ncbi:MAG TPA: NifU N-terminal domain-containing protein [Flavobacteriaceae bacterium]|nr:NifU N-terminal domain-containing protein [Flavobacteriaceae bacterium]
MIDLRVNIHQTKYRNIKKFTINYFFVNYGKYKYNSKKEAETSALASDLFQLPSVKTVFIAENFVAVEISEKFSWKKSEDTIVKCIQQHLTSGKKTVGNEPQLFPVEVYTEMDVGPGTLRFVCNKKLVIKDVKYDFNQQDINSSMATALFEFPYVKRVAFQNNHIIITKGGAVQWDEITMELRSFIRKYLMQGKPIVDDDLLHA